MKIDRSFVMKTITDNSNAFPTTRSQHGEVWTSVKNRLTAVNIDTLEDLLAVNKTDSMIQEWVEKITEIKAATESVAERGHGDMVAFLRVVGRADIAKELSKTFKHVRALRRKPVTAQNSVAGDEDPSTDEPEEPYVVSMVVELDDAGLVEEYIDILVTRGPCLTAPSSHRVHIFGRATCDRQADAEFVRQRLVKEMYDVLSAQGHRDPMKATYSKFIEFEDESMYTDVSGLSDSILVYPMGGGDSMQIRDKRIDDLRVEIYKYIVEHEKTWKAKSTRRLAADDWATREVPYKPVAYARWMHGEALSVVAAIDTAEPVPDDVKSKMSEMASRIEKLESVCQKLAYAALARNGVYNDLF